jgi:antitoxin MazE
MLIRVRRWGNSLALRIPKALAKETGLGVDSLVELSRAEGKLIITPAAGPRYTLDELLKGVTDENRHAEVDWGPPTAGEGW